MAINRASISKELLPGLNAVFGIEYNEVTNEHEALFDVENSDRAFEEEVLFTGFGTAPVKGEGSAVQYDDAQESYTARYTAETISLAFAVTEEAMEDNLYDTFRSLVIPILLLVVVRKTMILMLLIFRKLLLSLL